MKKINDYFFADDPTVSDLVVFYGMILTGIGVIILCMVSLLYMAVI